METYGSRAGLLTVEKSSLLIVSDEALEQAYRANGAFASITAAEAALSEARALTLPHEEHFRERYILDVERAKAEFALQSAIAGIAIDNY